MKVVILAAGSGSRLRPLTDHTPKCLLTVGGKTILGRMLENLQANGLQEIIIVTGYLEEQIRTFTAENFPELDIRFINNDRFDTTNNIFSLYLAKDAVGDQPMLMMDSDIVFDHRILLELLQSGYENCLALQRHPLGSEEIKVLADERGWVLEISKEVKPDIALGESIGIELFGNPMRAELFRVLDRMVNQERKVDIFYEAAFQELIDRGFGLHVVDITRYFCTEIDTPDDLRKAGEIIMSR